MSETSALITATRAVDEAVTTCTVPSAQSRTDDHDALPETLAALDGLLFNPRGWFCIDVNNERVAAVAPGTRTQALALIGQGRVASVVGKLRPEVLGIDVDLEVDLAAELGRNAALGSQLGEVSALVLDSITEWCERRNLWHLVRPSGGADGRAHVLVVPGRHRELLAQHLQQLRQEMRLTVPQLGARQQLRPLTAPHRSGRRGEPAAADAASALKGLREVVALLPSAKAAARPASLAAGASMELSVSATGRATAKSATTTPTRPRTRPVGAPSSGDGGAQRRPGRSAGATESRSAASTVPGARRRSSQSAALTAARAAVAPAPRRRRELPPEWATYLADGIRPSRHQSSDRSTVELAATGFLVRAGFSEDVAWATITSAHPDAFTKSRGRGRVWWRRYQWTAAVASADAFMRTQRQQGSGGDSTPVGAHARNTRVRRGEPVQGSEDQRRARSAVSIARELLEQQWRFWPAATRHTDLDLARTLLDTMDRRGRIAVAVPQRELQVDSALLNRNTVRASLDRLTQLGLFVVEQTYVRGTTDTSNTVHLGAALQPLGSPEADMPRAVQSSQTPTQDLAVHRCGPETGTRCWTAPGQGTQQELTVGLLEEQAPASTLVQEGVGQEVRGRALWWIAPPKSHTPAPTRRHLTPRRTHLLHALQASGPLASLPVLAARAGRLHLTRGGSGELPELTPAQRRAVIDDLRFLAELGLAQVDGLGQWTSAVAAERPVVLDRDLIAHREHQLEADLAAERAEFRTVLTGEARRVREDARRAKLTTVRQKAWWNSLTPQQQQERQEQYRTLFAALPAPMRQVREEYLRHRVPRIPSAARLTNLPLPRELSRLEPPTPRLNSDPVESQLYATQTTNYRPPLERASSTLTEFEPPEPRVIDLTTLHDSPASDPASRDRDTARRSGGDEHLLTDDRSEEITQGPLDEEALEQMLEEAYWAQQHAG